MTQATQVPLRVAISLDTGAMAPRGHVQVVERRLSDMRGMFQDDEAAEAMIAAGDPVLYRFYAADTPDAPPHLRFGTTVVRPGKVGDEYFMTRGHYHALEATPEVYFCLAGRGCFVMETRQGAAAEEFVEPGHAVYIPPGWAHRSVNVGPADLVFFYACPGGAGHDYATFARQGFGRIVVERDGRPAVLPNPRIRRHEGPRGG